MSAAPRRPQRHRHAVRRGRIARRAGACVRSWTTTSRPGSAASSSSASSARPTGSPTPSGSACRRIAIEHVQGRVQVTVGVSHPATVVAAERARSAERMGATAVMVSAPAGSSPGPALRDHFRRVGGRALDPSRRPGLPLRERGAAPGRLPRRPRRTSPARLGHQARGSADAAEGRPAARGGARRSASSAGSAGWLSSRSSTPERTGR